jgi:hypothetical protein
VLGLVGVTSIDSRVAESTVRTVLPETPSSVAVIVADPVPTEVAVRWSPVYCWPWQLPYYRNSMKPPRQIFRGIVRSRSVAVNCWEVPRAILGIAGVMSMSCRTAFVTVRTVLPDFPPNVAVMVAGPTAMDEAKPSLAPMVTLAGSDELHADCVVRSWTVLSEKIPVAVHCWLLPSAVLGFVGVTSTDTSVADVTVRVVLPKTVPDVAVMVAEPAVVPDAARPLEPAVLLTVPTSAADELHVQMKSGLFSYCPNKCLWLQLRCVPRAMLG